MSERQKLFDDRNDAINAHLDHLELCPLCRATHCEIGKFLTTRAIDLREEYETQ